jgi:heme o synthase
VIGGYGAASGLAGLAQWRSYVELTKPKVVALITFTSLVGAFLASSALPRWNVMIWSTLGIALASGCAAAINHVIDRRTDATMAKTCARPLDLLKKYAGTLRKAGK